MNNTTRNTTALLFQHGQDILIHIGFIFWVVLAAVFYQERIFSDAGFYLSKMVHYQTFWTEVNRFIRIFSQWLPLLFIKLEAPMTVVMVSYSIGHILFYYGCYLIARLVYQCKEAGWVFLLLQTVGLLYGFCAPGFEYYYVAAFLVLWILALQQPFTWRNILWQFFLLFFIITGYRTAVVFVVAALGLHAWQYGLKYWKYYIGVFIYLGFWWWFKRTYITSYEQEKMAWTIHLIKTHTFEWEYYWQLLGFYWQHYKSMWLLIFMTVAIYLRHKKFGLVLIYILGLIAIQYLVSITYGAIKHSRYQEQCFFPMSIMAVLPLLLHAQLLLKQRQKQVLIGVVFGVVIYRLILVPSAIQPYSERVALQHRLIEEGRDRAGTKFIVQQDFNPLIADLTFGFNMETLLLSALQPEKKAVQIIRAGEWQKLEKEAANPLQNPKLYMATYKSYYDRPDSIYQHSQRNKAYYPNFEPSSYRWLNGAVANLSNMKPIRHHIQLQANPRLYYSANKMYNIAVKIENNSQVALPAQQIRLAYHWTQNGEVVEWEGQRSLLEVDVRAKTTYTQPMVVQMPTEKGTYELQLDMVIEGVDWLGQGSRHTVIID